MHGRPCASSGWSTAEIELVAHAYNTTFAVQTTDGQRYALRVGTSSQSSEQHVVAQQAWQLALAEQTEVGVPVPLRTPAGAWCTEVDCPGFDRSLLVTAASWLDGPDVGELDVPAAGALGRTMALLHGQAEHWPLPSGGAMPALTTPLFGDVDLLEAPAGLTADQRETLAAARAETDRAFAVLHADSPLRPIHADLHGDNLKWCAGRLVVFDFDDCGLGLPAVDLAVTTFYLREDDPTPEEAFRVAYGAEALWPDIAPADFEALVAARQLLLANSLLASSHAQWRGQAAEYLHLAVARLRHWLVTGRFTRAVLAADGGSGPGSPQSEG